MTKITFLLILCIGISLNAQVGINNADPKTELDVEGAISLREGNVLTLSNGNTNNNINLGATPYSFYRITGPTASFTISSIAPAIATADGQIVTFENTTDQPMVIRHNGGGTTENRILCPGAQNYTLYGQYATITFQYNNTQNRWVIVNRVDARYGDNIRSVIGTSNIGINTNTFTDMTNMSITFTPKHSTVYLNFSAAGHSDIGSGIQQYVDFRLVNVTAGNAVLAGTSSLCTDFDFDDILGSISITSWNAHFTMFPVSVTPGVSTTLKIQWSRDGNFPASVYNWVTALPDSAHRSLTILD
ncbi:hypothetical protein [Psychroserpens sp.]|uniref:hypothetical protein n=1 Tax=Psychroserpens sp. TaxID=2020870 RepID=UPI002B270088|nr:hypothetical protein [Psychroserpens sp.]